MKYIFNFTSIRCATKIAECAAACCVGGCTVSASCVACLGSFYEDCKSCWSWMSEFMNETVECLILDFDHDRLWINMFLCKRASHFCEKKNNIKFTRSIPGYLFFKISVLENLRCISSLPSTSKLIHPTSIHTYRMFHPSHNRKYLFYLKK